MVRVLGTTDSRFTLAAVVLLAVVWAARVFWGSGRPLAMAFEHPASQASDAANAIPDPEVRLEGIADRVATILDTTYTTHLVPLILHFSAVLGPAWPIVFFTSRETLDAHFDAAKMDSSSNDTDNASSSLSAAWARSVAEGRIQVVAIPRGTQLGSRDDVNRFLSSPWMYVQLAPARHMLVFQADSMVCANSARSIDDFVGYDMIGAPWGPDHELWYNGGLSLRNRDLMMRVLRERDYAADMKANRDRNWSTGEDVWFAQGMRAMNGSMPTRDEARRFAVEWDYTWVDAPFGYHRVHKELPGRLDEIRAWCPEIDLARANYLRGEEKTA